mmetsp:Transcript_27434/g.91232  ORF Transcript_27434/g.91232 Transcript_27434/m.91232 type:complete len:245 (-) Transcript_27434:171-905(-)
MQQLGRGAQAVARSERRARQEVCHRGGGTRLCARAHADAGERGAAAGRGGGGPRLGGRLGRLRGGACRPATQPCLSSAGDFFSRRCRGAGAAAPGAAAATASEASMASGVPSRCDQDCVGGGAGCSGVGRGGGALQLGRGAATLAGWGGRGLGRRPRAGQGAAVERRRGAEARPATCGQGGHRADVGRHRSRAGYQPHHYVGTAALGNHERQEAKGGHRTRRTRHARRHGRACGSGFGIVKHGA